VREIMVFLHSHGVSTARAVRIFKTNGADAIHLLSVAVGYSRSTRPASTSPASGCGLMRIIALSARGYIVDIYSRSKKK
jgi:hypothetical protein